MCLRNRCESSIVHTFGALFRLDPFCSAPGIFADAAVNDFYAIIGTYHVNIISAKGEGKQERDPEDDRGRDGCKQSSGGECRGGWFHAVCYI